MNNLNILIVEDESLIALGLMQLVKSFGCTQVKYATHPKKAKKVMQEEEINLILMDINLKYDVTGIELYKSFQTDIHVIYITAYNDEKTIQQAIETNPLGYLTKPYNQDELKALLLLATYKILNDDNSGQSLDQSDMLVLGKGYHFDEKKEKLYLDHIHINLGTKELKLLKLLIYHRGYVVDLETIENEVWAEETVSDSAVRTLVYRLRGKLKYQLIQSVFNQGIKIEITH